MMNELFSLTGKTALVTGALGLLGKQHCIALSEAGANVVVADIDAEKSKEFAETMRQRSIGLPLDVTSEESVISVRDIVMESFGHIDVLINNAAVNDMVENPIAGAESSMFENYPLELWRKVMEVNVTGMFLCSQIFGSVMAQQGSGSIINIASTYGVVAPDQSIYQLPEGAQAFFKSGVYPASKGAVISFTRFLAAYWGKKGVRVNALSPGGVENNQPLYFIENYSRKTPLGSMSRPTDYKGAVIFLASDASRYMTGANLIIDGGWTAW